MRIAFLHGCAEPGKDGVGDYTALLAAQCERSGHSTLRIALHDPYVTGPEVAEGVLRLGAGIEWEARVEQARETVESFGAEVISLQWVPYSFHSRGTPWGIEKNLARIAGERPVQIMCHEIWIGAEQGAGIAHRLVGTAQRAVMRRIFRSLHPAAVDTSNAAYAAVLSRLGVNAQVLPLFGSIPITGGAVAREDGVARFGMFGELHPVWPSEPLLGLLRGMGKHIEIEHIGRIGQGLKVWREMERRYGNEFRFKLHGEQPATRISQFLMEMDFGIATTPLALLGKSGTVAAMLEHGLPVIVNRDEVRYPGLPPGSNPEGVIMMDQDLPSALRAAKRRPPRSKLPETADHLLESLQKTRAAQS